MKEEGGEMQKEEAIRSLQDVAAEFSAAGESDSASDAALKVIDMVIQKSLVRR